VNQRTYVIPGRPFPLRRHRTRNGHSYDPPENRLAKKWVQEHATEQGVEVFHKPTPVLLNLEFVYARPQKPKHQSPIGRPDIDNLVKLVLDALNKIAWDDDAQVVDIAARKLYEDIADGCTRITIGVAT